MPATSARWTENDDGDSDGACADVDNCPLDSNPVQTDTDSDSQGDACDLDDDNDGVLDSGDPSPLDPFACGDIDADSCDDCSIGSDGLGPLPDTMPGNDGTDFDGDGLCDAGDPDDDNDQVADVDDAAPFDPFVCRDADGDGCEDCSSGTDNPNDDGPDNEQDGLCDPGDDDDDNDGAVDDKDNCPIDPNPFQQDNDGDGIGNECDPCLGDPFNDVDLDGRCYSHDNCPTVANPSQADANGNGVGDACEFVTVDDSFRISSLEVTNARYVKFLNAVAVSDPNELFSVNMTISPRGGILRLGTPGNYNYVAKFGFNRKPVNFVSWLDAARFVNWLENGSPSGIQRPGTTEKGTYDLTVEDPQDNAVRDPHAEWFLPTKSEWDTAAYADPSSGGTLIYPTRSNLLPIRSTANANGGTANPGLNVANYNRGADWNGQNGNVTSVAGCGPLSVSPWGTHDQAGNVAEWVEDQFGNDRIVRGGSYRDEAFSLRSDDLASDSPFGERDTIGFRVARTK